jgi:hypothetical protein
MSKAESSALGYIDEALRKINDHHERRRRDTALLALKRAEVPNSIIQEVMGELGFRYRDMDALKKAISRARLPE